MYIYIYIYTPQAKNETKEQRQNLEWKITPQLLLECLQRRWRGRSLAGRQAGKQAEVTEEDFQVSASKSHVNRYISAMLSDFQVRGRPPNVVGFEASAAKLSACKGEVHSVTHDCCQKSDKTQ